MDNDRDRLLFLYKQLTEIQIPNFDNKEVDTTANTIVEGLKVMQSWLTTMGQKHFKSKKH